MIRPAEVRSFLVLRMRPSGCSGSSPCSPRTNGITLTPVSKPEIPRASFGKTSNATPIMISGLP
jgi:hypothetical protein